MSEKNYISGIFNYCDRWCERCAFTSRCRVFASDPTNIEGLPTNPDSPEFWEQLRNHFKDALEMLHDLAAEINETDHDEEEEMEENGEDGNGDELKSVDSHGLYNEINNEYGDAVEAFFQKNEIFFAGQESAYEEKVKSGIPVDVEQLGFLQEALSTIRWFQHFIYPKIDRALSHFDIDPDSAGDLQSDGNGSAKVAIIAIQRSIDAWTFIAQIFKEKEKEVWEIQELLITEKERMEIAYPFWEQFHRPGFDDEPDSVVRLDFNPN